MIPGSFVLFWREDRIRAAYLPARTDAPTTFRHEGRFYQRAGHFELQHHVINARNELAGFVMEDAEALTPIVSRTRFSRAKNCQWDGFSLAVLLTEDASSLEHDGASAIGQRVYYDGVSDIILLVEDMRERRISERWGGLYERLAFPLETQDVPLPEMAEATQ